MNIRTMCVFALLAGYPAVPNAMSMLDLVKAHIGDPVELAVGHDVYKATLMTVGDDHFCAKVHIAEFEHERCYSQYSISYVSPATEKRSFWIALIEPRSGR